MDGHTGRHSPGGDALTQFAVLLLIFTLAYTVTVESYTVWDFLMGAGLSAGLLLLDRPEQELRSDRVIPSLPHRLLWAVPFIVAVIVDITRGTWEVMLLSLGLRPLDHAGIVGIPTGERTPLGVHVSMLALSLSPGSILVKLDPAGETMWVHVVDASDPDAVRRQYQDFYDRYQRHVFP